MSYVLFPSGPPHVDWYIWGCPALGAEWMPLAKTKHGDDSDGGEPTTHKSPHSVMSSTICWGAKNCVMLHEDAGHAAEGVPHADVLSTVVALFTSAGTFGL